MGVWLLAVASKAALEEQICEYSRFSSVNFRLMQQTISALCTCFCHVALVRQGVAGAVAPASAERGALPVGLTSPRGHFKQIAAMI